MLNNTIFKILEEQTVLKTSRTKPIVDAIKNRKKISFYYSGPRTPKKDSVKPGYRVKVEPVALGLSKRGSLIVRAWVDSPSVTKTGFGKGHWRTFMLSRANNIEITDEVFNEKRPGFNQSGDSSMTVTYVTTDWNKQPEVKKPRILKPQAKPQQPTEPTPTSTEPQSTSSEPQTTEPQNNQPQTQELPQPKPDVKPELTPQDTTGQNTTDKEKELYDKKKSEWVNKQKEVGGNVKPGQGTRDRFKKEVEKELQQPKPEEKPSVNPEEEEEDKKLQESIKKIKHLMFS